MERKVLPLVRGMLHDLNDAVSGYLALYRPLAQTL